jgi:hypothetical protein
MLIYGVDHGILDVNNKIVGVTMYPHGCEGSI